MVINLNFPLKAARTFDEPLESSTLTPSKVRSILGTFDVDHFYACLEQHLWKV